jgi:hypothetical protein
MIQSNKNSGLILPTKSKFVRNLMNDFERENNQEQEVEVFLSEPLSTSPISHAVKFDKNKGSLFTLSILLFVCSHCPKTIY